MKRHKGLGDTVAAVTHALAIDRLAKQLAELVGKEDCGCEDRQEKLNKIFPYKNKNSEEEEE